MYTNLFTIKDDIAQPLKANEALIKEVRQIVKRDHGSNGDSDGRKKLFAYKELGAVYWLADYRSPGITEGYEGKELIEHAIRNFDLPATWQPDAVVATLIEKYKRNKDGGVAAEVLTEIVGTLRIVLKTVKAMRESLVLKLDAKNISDDDLKSIITTSSELLRIATEIPKKIKDINDARDMLKHEEDKAVIGRGGIKITSSMV